MLPLAKVFLGLYEQGWFPMADEDGKLKAYCYDPRGVLPLEEFHIPARFARSLRRSPYRITCDQAFADVVLGCSQRTTTWISQEIMDGFVELHNAGLAHSLEAWEGDQLVGGLYGIALGATFCGESMFSRASGASKACLVELYHHLTGRGFRLIDCQQVTPTLAQFGARYMPFPEYFRLFQQYRSVQCLWGTDG
jgi:leucyl/phenylalanyl-tRNA---protein transferase